MKFINDLKIYTGEKKIGNILFKGEMKFPSVNSSYYVDRRGDVKKSYLTNKFQKTLFSLGKANFKDNKDSYEKSIFLNIKLTKLLGKNKDGSTSKRGQFDIDNVLKATLDSLSGVIYRDDTQVMGILISVNYSTSENSNMYIKAYEYDQKEWTQMKENIKKERIDKLLTSGDVFIPQGMKMISFNSMYNRTRGKTSLTQEARKYKNFLTQEYKYNDSLTDITKDAVIVDLKFNIKKKTDKEDLDNKVKPVLDCMSSVFFKDDKQVEVLFLEKEEFENTAESIEYNVYKK